MSRTVQILAGIYVGCVVGGSLTLLFLAQVTGAAFGLAVMVAIVPVLWLFWTPAGIALIIVAARLPGFRTGPSRWVHSAAGLFGGLVASLIAEVYSLTQLTGPYDHHPGVPETMVFVAAPAFVVAFAFAVASRRWLSGATPPPAR